MKKKKRKLGINTSDHMGENTTSGIVILTNILLMKSTKLLKRYSSQYFFVGQRSLPIMMVEISLNFLPKKLKIISTEKKELFMKIYLR